MKNTIKNLILYCLCVAFLTGSINALYIYREKTNDHGTMSIFRNDKGTIQNVPYDIKICNFGNSHGYYGFDYEKSEMVCFNFGMPDQSLFCDSRILEAYKDHIASDAKVFITISFTSLLGPDEGDEPVMDKRYYKFLPRKLISGYTLKNALYTNYFPGLAANDAVSLFEVLLGRDDNTDLWSMNTSAEYSAYHGPMRYKNHVAASLDTDNKRMYRENEKKYLCEMIDLCNKLGAKVILITPPYLHEYTDPIIENDPEFYDDLHRIINEICIEKNVSYTDYSRDERFMYDYNLFFNTDHMNRQGALRFTETVLNELT